MATTDTLLADATDCENKAQAFSNAAIKSQADAMTAAASLAAMNAAHADLQTAIAKVIASAQALDAPPAPPAPAQAPTAGA
jgi:hypothetical protein